MFISRPIFFSIAATCPAISPALRLRTKPESPVAQKVHCSGQPTCVEMQAVSLSPCFISTDSTDSPSRSFHRNFLVPSADFCSRARTGKAKSSFSASFSRSGFDRFVISSGSSACFCQIHWHICPAR